MTTVGDGPIVVSGATGNVGGEVVAALVSRGARVRALTRDPGRRPAPPGAAWAPGDLDRPASLASALEGAAALFLLPGFADMAGIVEQARTQGARRVVLLSGRSAGRRDLDDAITTYMRDSETAVRQGGLAWTILRPGALMSNVLAWAPSVRRDEAFPVPFAWSPVAAIDPADVAGVAARALLDGEHAGETLEITGPEALSAVHRARALAARLGRPVRLRPLEGEAARDHVLATVPQPYADALLSFSLDGTLDESPVLPTVAQVLGRPARTFGHWVEA
ncbi:MAG TPA: NAD(P)H-binding protein, partial [Capillimicrobium sp.]